MNRWTPIIGVFAGIALTSVSMVTASAAPYQGLTRSEVLTVLSAASERGNGGEHLALDGKIVTVSDGRGGTLTAVPVVRAPSADGYGQYVLFWHDKAFVGSDRLARLPYLGEESVQASIAQANPNALKVRFARYRSTDPMYAPSLPQQFVTYHWDGVRLVASEAVSLATGNGLSMRLPDTYSGQLTLSMVMSVLGRATESKTGMHLAIAGKMVTVSDGEGGTLSAVPVVRTPTADGYGQYVLFWHGTSFVGSDRLARLPYLGEESVQISVVSSGPNRITLRFACYRPTDPMYAPSLPSVDVSYRWDGWKVVASRAVPLSSGNGLAMWLSPPTG